MIYVYSPKTYIGLESLIATLGAVRLYRFDGEDFWDRSKRMKLRLEAESFIIPWGTTLPELERFKVINSMEAPINRFEQLELLSVGKVRHIPVYKESTSSLEGKDHYVCRQYDRKLDLNRSPFFGDYYTEKYEFSKEFVIHSFLSKALRFGEKKPKIEGAHPWIRNEVHGWTIDYTVPSTPELRSIAHKAIKALGLSFGVVEVGLTTSGILTVISVNLAPDLTSSNIIKAYANSISKWINSFKEEQGESIDANLL